jgi:hypothetical protein
MSIIDSSVPALSASNMWTGNNTFQSGEMALKYPSILYFQTSTGANGASLSNPVGLGIQSLTVSAPGGLGFNTNNPYTTGSPGVVFGAVGSASYGNFAVLGSSADATVAYSGFSSTSPISQSILWTLPNKDGPSGYYWQTDGSGHLGWGAGGAGASSLGVNFNKLSVSSPTAQINFAGSGVSVSATGSTATVTITAGTGISSPSTFTWTSNFGLTLSTGEVGSSSSVTGPDGTNSFHGAYMSIRSSGTAQGLLVDERGTPAGGAQNQIGAVTIRNDANPGNNSGALLVLVDSSTDAQVGYGELELWSNSPTHNDPLLWFHRTSSNSSPEIRFDSPSPNSEMVNTSTDNAHGLGKWEPFAEASQGIDLQVNSRAYDNTTFENLAFWHPLQAHDGQPAGLYLSAQSLVDDPILTSSNTSTVRFATLNGHDVGITGPLNVASGSWDFRLPSTPNNQGQVLYQSDNGDAFSARSWAFTTGGSAGQLLQNNGTSAPTWTSTISASSITFVSGTSSPYEATFSSSTVGYQVAISTNGHIITAGSAPTVGSCGSTPSGFLVQGDDNEGIISVGGSTTACSLTFAHDWGVEPVCVFTGGNGITVSVTNPSHLLYTIAVSGNQTDVFYMCRCSGVGCK